MTTIGQILVNETLPQKYRDYNRTLGADEIEDILATIARDDPALYSDVSGKLMRLGTEAAYESGATLRLSDIRPIIDKSKHLAFLDAQEAKIRSAKNLTPKQREELIDDLYNSVNSVIEKETYATGVSKANPFAMQVKSKARGTPGQFASIVSTPGIYKDSNGKTVQTFIRNSYAEGLTPAELWAGSYGARTGVVSTKFATAKGGAFGKKVSSVCIDQVVTEDDCGAPYGFPVKASDKDNIGCVLQQDVGGYPAGTVITKSVFADLQKKNLDEILVRSPVTCSCKDGICSKCAGIRETGKFPEIGYNIGLNAGSALGERIAQGSLNTKHTGRKIEGASRFSGFEMLKAMADVPKQYPDKAILSDIDGKVTKIIAAPQGGNYIYVNDQRHYVPQGYDLMVKEGDELEAGDQMSDGVINTAEVVKYKGIGEGRRYFTNRFTQAFRDSGYKASRRNIEVLARSLVDHVEINDPEAEGQFLPGDVATYSQWSFGYKPRPTAVRDQPGKLLGSYLEEPVLHYTVGSRVTKKMVDDLKKFKVDKILADKQPIEVTPIMKSITEGPAYKGDWVGRLGTTYIKQRLVEDAQHGAKSNIHGVHPLPGIAKGVEFGNYGEPGVNRPGGFTY
jgi:DNA-directed RNA polymerase subunit beta'